MDQVGGLLPDRGHDLGMAVAGRVDRDPGREVEEQVAVDVLDDEALAADRHDRIGPRQAGRGPRLIVGDVRLGLRAGELGHEVGHRPGPARRLVGWVAAWVNLAPPDGR